MRVEESPIPFQSRMATRFLSVSLLLVAGCTSTVVDTADPIVDYWSGTRSERTEAIAACLEAKGWTVELIQNADGSSAISAPGVSRANSPDFYRDAGDCDVELPPIKWPETEAEYREYYERWIGRYDCMVDAGFDLDEAPSFDTWYEVMLSGEGYSDATYLLRDSEQWFSAVQACPADPEAFW